MERTRSKDARYVRYAQSIQMAKVVIVIVGKSATQRVCIVHSTLPTKELRTLPALFRQVGAYRWSPPFCSLSSLLCPGLKIFCKNHPTHFPAPKDLFNAENTTVHNRASLLSNTFQGSHLPAGLKAKSLRPFSHPWAMALQSCLCHHTSQPCRPPSSPDRFAHPFLSCSH